MVKEIKNWMDKNKQVFALGVLVALIVTILQFSFQNLTVSLVSILGGILVMLIVVKKWIWPTMWGFAIITETIALFVVIYFIMAMLYLMYVVVALKFGWASIPVIEINNTLFYLGQSAIP